MTTYDLTKDGQDFIKHMMKKRILIVVILFVIAIFVAFLAPKENIFMITNSIIMLTVVIVMTLLFLMKIQLSTRIILDDNKIILQDGGNKDIVIHRDQVRRVDFIEGDGIRIHSNKFLVSIFLPVGLDNYEQLESIIRSWSIAKN